MKTTQITPNSLQLTRFGLCNCYLVREASPQGDSFTLIDTTLPGSTDAILAAALAAGAPIRRILLTHAHGDHVGSLDALMQKLGPETQLAASARSLPLLQPKPDKSLQPGEPAAKIKGSLPGVKSQPTHLLAEGELFGSLRVIETPGHIPGHLAFLDERDGTLFTGDALVCVGRLAVSGYAPWYFPLPNVATWHKPTAIASARKLLTYDIARFAAGHGAIRSGGIPALKQALQQTGA